MKRAITIQPNLAAWLRAYPLEKFPIMPRGFRRLRLKFRKQFDLSHDVLRHTFISMFVAKFRSLGDAALPGRKLGIDHQKTLPRPENSSRGRIVLRHSAETPGGV